VLRPPEIRSVRFYNDVYITIANARATSQIPATVGGEPGSATARAISFMLFGHEASIVMASIWLSPLLVWTWNDRELRR